jgi:glycosyltransferase involved in cell wall biosynthesis
MNIVQVYDKAIDPANYEGGAAEVVMEQSMELQKEFDVTVLTSDRAPGLHRVYREGVLTYQGLTLLRLKGVLEKDAPPPFCRRVRIPSFPRQLAHMLDDESFVVHAHFMASELAVQAITIAKTKGIRSVYQPHFHPPHIYPDEERRIREQLLTAQFIPLLREADIVIAVNPTELALYQKLLKDESKVHLVPNGVDVEELKTTVAPHTILEKYAIPEDHQVILTVGRLSQRKNVLDVVKVFHRLHNAIPNTTLVICGRKGNQYPQIQRYLTAHPKLAKAVRYRGFVPTSVRNALLRIADVFPILSRWEAFGIAAAQALACGTPVIATDIGGLPSFIHDQVDGFLVQNGDLNAAADRMKWLLRHEDAAHEMGKAGKNLIRRRYSWRTIGEQLRSIYRSLP